MSQAQIRFKPFVDAVADGFPCTPKLLFDGIDTLSETAIGVRQNDLLDVLGSGVHLAFAFRHGRHHAAPMPVGEESFFATGHWLGRQMLEQPISQSVASDMCDERRIGVGQFFAAAGNVVERVLQRSRYSSFDAIVAAPSLPKSMRRSNSTCTSRTKIDILSSRACR